MEIVVGLIVGVVLYLGVVVLIGAVMLRVSIALANRFLGETPGEMIVEGTAIPGHSPIDPNNPFSAPQVQEVAVAGGIPVPSFGRACVITTAQAIAGFVVSFALGLTIGFLMSLGSTDGAAAGIVAQLVSFLVVVPLYGLVLSTMLPTTFRRGLLVLLSQMLIGIAIGLVILVLVLAVGFGTGI